MARIHRELDEACNALAAFAHVINRRAVPANAVDDPYLEADLDRAAEEDEEALSDELEAIDRLVDLDDDSLVTEVCTTAGPAVLADIVRAWLRTFEGRRSVLSFSQEATCEALVAQTAKLIAEERK